MVPEVQQDMGISLAEAQKSVNTFVSQLHPLTGIHLYSHTKYEIESNGDIQYVYIFLRWRFSFCYRPVNFTNLSIARSVERAREVGCEKYWAHENNSSSANFLQSPC